MTCAKKGRYLEMSIKANNILWDARMCIGASIGGAPKRGRMSTTDPAGTSFTFFRILLNRCISALLI